MNFSTLISAEQLKTLLSSSRPVMVFDCSFDLGQSGLGRQQYVEAHIPGAVYASLDTALSAHGGPSASGGRHPLPTREAFVQWLTRVGMTNTTQAVVMDRNGVNYCGRLWWMLKWVGHENVAVLDGGL
ncbi:MAG: sulfurtransferase, partial [Polaromonas sp.]|nr:sulfurtransferase [Polaromonas sp.]